MLELLFPSFIAGILTFLAPCTLPLIPGYFTFISGHSFSGLDNRNSEINNKAKVFLNGLFFVIGFSVVFILLGLFAGALGELFFESKIWLSRIGGIIVIFFGLMMLNVFSLPSFLGERKLFNDIKIKKRGTYGFSFFLGVVFASGWSPCVGPVLGSVLVLAGSSATAFSGAVLLSVFSLGLAIPFLLIALGVNRAERIIQKYTDKLWIVSKIGGVLLVLLGILLLTNKTYLFVEQAYSLLDFVNYNKLMNYL